MTKEDCFYFGYIARKVGIKGELGFVLDVDNPLNYQKLESVFVERNNNLIPFFVKNIRIYNNTATVSFEDITTSEKAEELIKSQLYLPLTLLPKLKGKKFYFHEIKGFKVIDTIHGDIGIITGVLEFPQQGIFQIMNGEKEILIPAKEEFIVAINREKKEIHVNPPEGLIDIYLDKEKDNEDEKESD